jgi:hypothetical protein
MRKTGLRPFYLGLFAATIVAAFSLTMVLLMGIA